MAEHFEVHERNLGVVGMGEIADMHIDGTLCQVCGCLNEELIPISGNDLLEPPGHPIICEDCGD